ncbi:MAG: ATP-binding cassette domain-containing protein [bacterium]|nr:ATP-binding cassette domain-containing protein [bacterium]
MNRTLMEWKDISFRYAGTRQDALRNICLRLAAGELHLLAGPTGCGKSTLLKTVNGLIPSESAGRMEGGIFFDGERSSAPAGVRPDVGFMFQNPEDQLLCSRVESEIAFGPENLGLSVSEIGERIESALSAAAMGYKRGAAIHELSGGEKQRVALASALAMRPRILVLDEPTSQLDDSAAGQIVSALVELKNRFGLTILLAEHRIDRLLPYVDRLTLMGEGRIRGSFPRENLAQATPLLEELGLVPPPAEDRPRKTAPAARPRSVLLQASGISHRYPSAQRPALDDVSFDLRAGEILGLRGLNGAGKSTLLHALAGLLRLQAGAVAWFGDAPGRPDIRWLAGRVGFLFQNPDLMLTADTVEEEIGMGARFLGWPREQAAAAAERSIALLELEAHRRRNPFSLSRGERLRLALAALFATSPRVLLLDEPTAGLDRRFRLQFLARLRRWVDERPGERAAILCTHDQEALRAFADRTLHLAEGKFQEREDAREGGGNAA